MSGTYNLAVTKNVHQWEAYVLRCLSKIWKKTQKAMVFNLQSSALPEAYISKDKIYYAAVDSLLHKMEHMIASPILVTERSLPRDVTIVIERTWTAANTVYRCGAGKSMLPVGHYLISKSAAVRQLTRFPETADEVFSAFFGQVYIGSCYSVGNVAKSGLYLLR